MDELLVNAGVIGIGATLVMDMVALTLKRGFGIRPLDYALVGRWAIHACRGQAVHRPITATPPVAYEAMVGWGLHYLIGVMFAVVFLLWSGEGWLAEPRAIPAIAFGALTVLAPFLVLQPGMGAGLAARRTPRPGTSRLRSLTAHLSFGVGIWVAAVFLSTMT
ncbi:DUF2938 domain-containing protein [Rhodovulum sulfidophilum]|uniref:DUF2938 domain-containing protein n=1 Tax=Rhodovulum sulfidophilum TaxID=35806 RepID=UPI0019217A49|nr:DUF2938 domain-containing protein [Rhodovulum sulfidophilum]MBL3595253.1 DUF2938 domain-containing protein [Rhodovulum sulfidophilum]